MKYRFAIPLLLLAFGCNQSSVTTTAAPSTPDEKPQALEMREFQIGSSKYALQIADDEPKREKGLMYRKTMPADEGMIFVFTDETPRNFWMKNTPIDLDILYLDHAGKVVSIKTMYAFATNDVPSEEPAQYAIEVNGGVAEKNHWSPGMKIDLSPLKSPSDNAR